MVAMKANASMMPPNCASTADAEVTVLRTTESGWPLASTYASTPPTTAPMTAVIADSASDCPNAASTDGRLSALRLSRVKAPSAVWNAPTTTMTVGTSRKSAT